MWHWKIIRLGSIRRAGVTLIAVVTLALVAPIAAIISIILVISALTLVLNLFDGKNIFYETKKILNMQTIQKRKRKKPTAP